MFIVNAHNADEALVQGMDLLAEYGVRNDSRNGPVFVMPTPVMTVYHTPRNRVLFNPARDANPFFHLYEALWMLGGRNDVESMVAYVKRMGTFSDNGRTLHGAYGHRWRHWFGRDQLDIIVCRLQADPTDRRCVLQMWDTYLDLDRDGKDVPCNTQIYFNVTTNDELDMTVMCRSNDIIWGAYGANLVHMSILHEYMALMTGLLVGKYYQLSNNYHAYGKVFGPLRRKMWERAADFNAANFTYPEHSSFFLKKQGQHDSVSWHRDLRRFLDGEGGHFDNDFFQKVAVPMHRAYFHHKVGDREATDEALALIQDAAWGRACREWVERRR